ncbi:hypothetical protein N0V87_004155 [Didymella glomerata]|uniref:Uncharacterized protein n=1 Tax=Didymella glomerata TaxID=749621 RepID=A0A9W8X1G2_9PLEO|nr:hypothetical protein N0V87_004155 [Didymella glomerata]
MQNVRNALLDHVPKGIPQAFGSEALILDLQSTRDSIARGEFEGLRGTAFHNRNGVVTDRYCAIGDGVDSLERYVHSLWYIYYQLACHISHEKSDQDGLVLDILRIQGLGPLSRPAPWGDGIDIARTTDGTLWNDLPFLVPNMTKFWVDHSGAMSSAHRLNLSTFLAKLASARVCKDRMCQIALHLFRYTFEEARELRDPGCSEDENTHRRLHGLDYANLLPSACAWLRIASHNIILLSDACWSDCSGDIGQGGTLFTESEFGNRCPKGYTPWRWMFWLKRLYEIRDAAKKAGDEEIERLTTGAIDEMIKGARERNSDILRVYKNGGEALHQEMHLRCLGKEPTSWEDVTVTHM